MAQTNAIGSTFDQAGDIGADKALFRANAHNAQNGGQRGKVIICNFGACRADGADQGGLANIGEADQANIRDHFQFQSQVHILTGQTGLGKARDLTGSASFSTVPRGTRMTRSSASLPFWRAPRPFSPSGAVYLRL